MPADRGHAGLVNVFMKISDFGTRANSGEDAVPAVRSAIKAMDSGSEKTLYFEPGRYDFWPDRASEAFLFISNNDEGLKRIAFPLFGLHDVTIDGQQSEFMFHGGVTPFVVHGCRNVCLTNFTIDYERPFHTEATVLDVRIVGSHCRAVVDLYIPMAYPYRIEADRLLFVGENGEKYPIEFALEFDTLRRETAFHVKDLRELGRAHWAQELEPGKVRLTADFETLPTPGNILVLKHCGRLVPGIFVESSEQIEVRDITLYHSGGMGLIAQQTKGIRVNRLLVKPPAHKERLVSLTADATHFVNCAGLIEISDCHFEGQLDDALNVHGIYARISEVVSREEIEVELVHGQQAGVKITYVGDIVEFVEQESLTTYHQATVQSIERINKQRTRILFDGPLPDEVKPGDVIGSTGWSPDLLARGNVVKGNRARGFLVTTPGRAIIEDNYFHTPGAAVSIEADANYWFESGSVRNVCIKNNHFDNCNYGVWGRATIDINPQVESASRPGVRTHKGITIQGNTFDAFTLPLVKAQCVDGLIISRNKVGHSTDYSSPRNGAAPWDICHSSNLRIEHNTLPDTQEYQ